MKKTLIIFMLLFCFTQVNSFDITTLGTINSSVIDKVGVLKPEEKTIIENKIQELRDKFTTEIFLVILKTTDSEEISSVGTEIGQKVGVGKSDKDNGVLLLIAIDDRTWNISTGYGVEGVLPDILTNRIGEKNFILFRESKYFEGIDGAITDIGKAFEGDPDILSLKEKNTETPIPWMFELIIIFVFSYFILRPLIDKKQYNKFWFILAIAFFATIPFTYIFIKDVIATFFINIAIWIIALIFGIIGKSGYNGSPTGRGKSSGGGFGGFGGKGGGGGGGGFGGFGGGGFGGGGSSGKW